MGNNPHHLGGATDVAAGDKAIRLIQLCDTFHLPLVASPTSPGLMVGLESERHGIERAGARLLCAVVDSRMPWLTFVVRRLYGVGGQSHHRPTGCSAATPGRRRSWGSMHIAGGASAAYRREIEAAADPAAKRREIEARLQRWPRRSAPPRPPARTSSTRATRRPLLFEFVEDAQRILARQLGPPAVPYRP